MNVDESGIRIEIADAIGSAHVLYQDNDVERYLVDARRKYVGKTCCVAKPKNTLEVSEVIKICAKRNIAVIPQGGNTGLCGGATPMCDKPSVVLSLERMNNIREVDSTNSTITVDAGCTLAYIQQVSRESNKLFPLSLGSEGSCQIGGNIATNAGGTNVLKYGPMRDLVLGVEVVLPNGDIWDQLYRLRKDNTGYDLKQLIIGSEGTLGVVTGAVLKLFTPPATSVTALASVKTVHDTLELYSRLTRVFGDRVTTFEIMSENEYSLVFAHQENIKDPSIEKAGWFAFVEITDTLKTSNLEAALTTVLEECFEDGVVIDATMADSIAQSKNIWLIRHSVTESHLKAGASIAHDSSVPISRIPDLVIRCDEQIKAAYPESNVYYVGHAGDGNVHVVVIFSHSLGDDESGFAEITKEVGSIVDTIAINLGGSISAEHGIGRSNCGRLVEHKGSIDMHLMKQVKNIFDPQNIMNPNVLFKHEQIHSTQIN